MKKLKWVWNFIHKFKKQNIMCYCNGYSGLAIADYLIEKSLSDGTSITNMSVLKMIFFAQGFGYSDLKRKLIKDDFYAWKFGPVEINTYEEFKKYGHSKITKKSNKTENQLNNIKEHPEIVEFLDKIYRLANIHPYILSNKTHEAGSPWDMTPSFQPIPQEIIANYYINKRWKTE